MKINELKLNVKTAYLYEGLTPKNKNSMMLWESAGRAINEAQLTADQIQQLFQQIEQGATAAGGNRTAVGMTKDAAAKVSAAYTDLKAKALDSGPVKGIDALYDQAAEKLKQATGGDQGAMQYVEKYRAFAKAHPVAQKLIYSALIAAAGISGAGAGGAAALGLFKMVDKLLQGEKFSTAAVAGAETGALAYGASKLGDVIKNTFNPSTQTGRIILGNGDTSADIAGGKVVGDIMIKGQMYHPGDSGYNDALKVMTDYARKEHMLGSVTDMTNYGTKQAKDIGLGTDMSGFKESRTYTPEQVTALFEHIVIAEGLFDKFKTAGANVARGIAGKNAQGRSDTGKFTKAGLGDKAGNLLGKGLAAAGGAVKSGAQAIGQKIATAGHNITTKTTADKLQSAWKAAGSPTDSEAIIDILTAQGIDAGVVADAVKAVNVIKIDRARLPNISKLNLQQKQAILKQLDDLDAGIKPAQQQQAALNQQTQQTIANQPKVDTNKIKATPNSGAPTPDEHANLQQKLNAAMAAQA